MKHTTSSMQALAFNFASGLRDAYNNMDTAHAQWKQSDDVSKAAFKAEWQLGYVMGRLNCDTVKAARILAQKRVDRTYEAELAVNAAGKDFSYNIKREGSKAKGKARAAAKSSSVEVTRAQRSALKAALEAFGGDARALRAALATM